MSQIGEGMLVKIPCRIQQGAFPDEYLITFSDEEKEVSGFVRREYIEKTSETEGYISGRVIHKESDRLTIQLQGSFFIGAAGKTSVSSSWADKHLARVG